MCNRDYILHISFKLIAKACPIKKHINSLNCHDFSELFYLLFREQINLFNINPQFLAYFMSPKTREKRKNDVYQQGKTQDRSISCKNLQSEIGLNNDENATLLKYRAHQLLYLRVNYSNVPLAKHMLLIKTPPNVSESQS